MEILGDAWGLQIVEMGLQLFEFSSCYLSSFQSKFCKLSISWPQCFRSAALVRGYSNVTLPLPLLPLSPAWKLYIHHPYVEDPEVDIIQANDLCLASNPTDQLQLMLDRIHTYAQRKGLVTNAAKSEIVHVYSRAITCLGGLLGGGFAGRVEEERRRRSVWALRSMAANPPDSH
eukprot:1014088-Pelagomonas_calceolata.AAC.1